MARLKWNEVSTRFYEMGVDRGVLFLNNVGFAWTGLVSISESPSGGEPRPHYIDGIKYLNLASAEEFEGTITAISSPLEFAECEGTAHLRNGLFATQQPKRTFGFSYRTKIGNDVDGSDHGYKIHLIYNALAGASERTYESLSDSAELEPQSWEITTLPPPLSGRRPTSHFVVDSRFTTGARLATLEEIIYGSETTSARLLSATELFDLFA